MKTLIITEKREAGSDLAFALTGDSALDKPAKTLEGLGKSNGFIEGDKYVISWAAGHLFRERMPNEINPSWGLGRKLATDSDYRLPEMLSLISKVPAEGAGKARQRKILKSLLSRKDIGTIINGCDADGEGERIFRDIVYYLSPGDKRSVLRFWNSKAYKSPVAVKDAMDGLKPWNDPKFEAFSFSQMARANGDYLTGLKLTKAACDYYNKPFYLGRVKGVIIGLVGNKELEIKNFVSKPFWTLGAKIKDLELSHFFYRVEEATDAEGKPVTVKVKEHNYFDKDKAFGVKRSVESDGLMVTVESYTTKRTKSLTRPLPLSGNDFTAEMMGRYKISPEVCEKILEYLRNEGFTTYQGTNGRYFSLAEKGEVEIALRTVNDYFKTSATVDTGSYIFNDKKSAEQNHPPLYVTEKVPTAHDLEKWKEHKLPHLKEAYELIMKRILVAFLEDDEIEKQHLVVVSPSGHAFELTGQRAIKQGWRTFMEEEIKDTTFSAPGLTPGAKITLDTVTIEESKTKKPASYTMKSLLDTFMNLSGVINKYIEEEEDPKKKIEWKDVRRRLMAVEGIGTDRTRVPIIKSLFDAKVLVKNAKGQITLSELGWELYHVSPSALKSIVMTARWEKAFEDIRNRKVSYSNFIQNLDKYIMDTMVPEIIKNVGKKVQPAAPRTPTVKKLLVGVSCPLCGKDVHETEKAYMCTGMSFDGKKRSGCTMGFPKDLTNSLGRKFEGADDFSRFIATDKNNPLNEGQHSVYFDKDSKFMTAVIWTNDIARKSSPEESLMSSGGSLPGAASSGNIIETSKTFRRGDVFVFKNFRGRDITREQAANLLSGKKIKLTRKSKAGTSYSVIATLRADGGLDAVMDTGNVKSRGQL